MNIFKKIALKLKLIKPKQNWFKKFFKSFRSLFSFKLKSPRVLVAIFTILFLLTTLVTYVLAQRGANPFEDGSNVEIEIFTTIGAQTWLVPDGVNYVEVLVVAGGGGGGSSQSSSGGGGGGGAGGLKYRSSLRVIKGQSINVVVGGGGAPGVQGVSEYGSDGGNSSFGSLVAIGGGGGAKTSGIGRPGGSGGGGGYNGYSTIKYGGSGVEGEGNSGGNTSALSWAGGAGGGGAGGPGGDNKINHGGGDGGPGVSYDITGSPVVYSVGGNGGRNSPMPSPNNTGKGGDAAYAAGIPYAGGSGVVIIKYSISPNIKISTLESGLIGHWSLDKKDYEEGTVNLAPLTNYSNRNYGEQYNPSCWGGDTAFIEYFENGGYNNFPYKKLTKTGGGTGGCYLDEHYGVIIENNKSYVVSAYMKASRNISNMPAYILGLNRTADNQYRNGPTINLTTEWKRYSWVYNTGSDHAGTYSNRGIVYENNDLPLEVYWSGFQVEETLELTPYTKGTRVARVVDKSAYSNHGTNYGATFTEDRFGKEGGAMSFNGSSHLEFSGFQLTPNNNSVSLWIKVDSIPSDSRIIFVHGSSGMGLGFYNGNRLILTSGGNRQRISDLSNFKTGEWNHIAILYDSSNIPSVFINGIEPSYPSSENWTQAGNNLYIGKRSSGNNFNGLIDDFRIYNRALSESEIKSLYDTYNPKTTTGSLQKGLVLDMPLKLKYTKSEASGSEIMTDRTPYGNDAQNHGATITDEGAFFSGSGDHITLNHSSQYDIREAITLGVWIKRNTDFNQTTDVWLLGRSGSWYFYDAYSSGNIRGEVFIDGARRAARTVPVPFDENWYHVVYTYDSKTRTGVIYKNGESYSSITLSGLSNYLIDLSSGNFMSIGANSKSRKMTYSNFLIYNRALSKEEVKTLYDRGRSDAGIIFQEN